VTQTPAVAAPRWTAYMPLDSLSPAARNPKLHELHRIKASIRDHGFVDPGIADERTGRIISGHGRRESLIEMYADGEPMPDGLLLDDDGTWLVPVTRGWASRDDHEAETLIIQLNRLTEAGGWHHRTLAEMLEDLATQAPDLFDSLAMADDEMEKLLRAAAPEVLGDEPAAAADRPDDESLAPAPGLDSDHARTVTCPDCGHIFDPSH